MNQSKTKFRVRLECLRLCNYGSKKSSSFKLRNNQIYLDHSGCLKKVVRILFLFFYYLFIDLHAQLTLYI